jgi:nuclear pore complex protein Nup98-Nup96
MIRVSVITRLMVVLNRNFIVLLQVPFFSNDDDTPTTPKADALFIPRENPRALIICPMDQWPGKASEKASSFKDRYTSVNEYGKIEYIQCFSLP